MGTCKDCVNRTIGCHAECETYKAFKQKLEDKKRFLNQGVDAIRVSQEGFWRRCKG